MIALDDHFINFVVIFILTNLLQCYATSFSDLNRYFATGGASVILAL